MEYYVCIKKTVGTHVDARMSSDRLATNVFAHTMAVRPTIDGTLHGLMNQLLPNMWAVIPSPPGTSPFFVTYNPDTHAVSHAETDVPNKSFEDALETLVNGSEDIFDAQPWSQMKCTMLPPRPWDKQEYCAYSRKSNGPLNIRATDLIGRDAFFGTVVIFVAHVAV